MPLRKHTYTPGRERMLNQQDPTKRSLKGIYFLKHNFGRRRKKNKIKSFSSPQ
jgi:hypothetical protein